MTLKDKHIVVGVCGGISAFKAVEVVRELGRRDAHVRVMMTGSAQRFIGALTFSGITGQPALTDLWDASFPGEVHVELSRWADAIVIVPATANLLAKVASGLADEVVTATLSCARTPVFYAPAMHDQMWKSAANQRNVEQLTRDGARFIGPVHGALASGEVGNGRLVEPRDIVDTIERQLGLTRDLEGRTILITAGPTHEDIDPVRFISNRSSGRMGYAIAQRATDRGAKVILISGPVALAAPSVTEFVATRSALAMHEVVTAKRADADVIIMTAAVADYRPAHVAHDKIKKSSGTLSIELVKNPDILAELGASRSGKRPVLVGFAMETTDLLGYARRKLTEKKVDLIVANHAAIGFGGDDNEATFVDAAGDEALPLMSKHDLADRILDRVLTLL
jgi:phosphopantothenoylcysteine decarboxylase/phosphopantothenate--cysteine ligase